MAIVIIIFNIMITEIYQRIIILSINMKLCMTFKLGIADNKSTYIFVVDGRFEVGTSQIFQHKVCFNLF